MMNNYIFIYTKIAVFLCCLFSTSFSQSTIWNYRPNSESSGIFISGRQRSRDISQFLDPLDDRSPRPLPVYGPLPRNHCPMKEEILDPKNIEATREAITYCTEEHTNCYYAKNSKFRTIDGSCNNIEHPSWGKADNCLQRILPFDYADKISYPRVSCTGKLLPNPRHISNVYHKEIKPKPNHLTTHFMEWGQMLAHDLSLNDVFRTPESGYHFPINCCTDQGPIISDMCYSVAVPPDDPFFPRSQKCISYSRTVPCPLCKSGQRTHWNQNTGFHDLSLVYGSNEEEAYKLRSGELGMLDVEYNRKSGPMPPTVKIEEICVSPPGDKACYKTGDQRANQNPFLLTVHTYLLRHHNFLCQELNEINPHWDDERLYQEARRINIAIAQYITYGHYLPNVLGEIMVKQGIQILPGAKYTKYNPEEDPSLADEYTTVAARYGHTLVPGKISQIDPKTEKEDAVWLRDYYYTPFGFRYGMYDETAKGMTVDRKMKHDVFLSDDVRNYLYRRLYMNETVGVDLAAASIVRGRDHGIPGYTYYLSYFFNITVRDFEDLKGILPSKTVDILEDLYESVHDIDFYSAGLAEYYVKGGFVGPTFGAVLGQQYHKLKFGDRYWFEHENQAGSFTPEQLVEIKKMSVSRILCETTRVMKIQREVFKPPSITNPVVSCDHIHRLNFLLWKE